MPISYFGNNHFSCENGWTYCLRLHDRKKELVIYLKHCSSRSMNRVKSNFSTGVQDWNRFLGFTVYWCSNAITQFTNGWARLKAVQFGKKFFELLWVTGFWFLAQLLYPANATWPFHKSPTFIVEVKTQQILNLGWIFTFWSSLCIIIPPPQGHTCRFLHEKLMRRVIDLIIIIIIIMDTNNLGQSHELPYYLSSAATLITSLECLLKTGLIVSIGSFSPYSRTFRIAFKIVMECRFHNHFCCCFYWYMMCMLQNQFVSSSIDVYIQFQIVAFSSGTTVYLAHISQHLCVYNKLQVAGSHFMWITMKLTSLIHVNL